MVNGSTQEVLPQGITRKVNQEAMVELRSFTKVSKRTFADAVTQSTTKIKSHFFILCRSFYFRNMVLLSRTSVSTGRETGMSYFVSWR
jgi:hypothetical protein